MCVGGGGGGGTIFAEGGQYLLADYVRGGQFPLADYVRGDKICGDRICSDTGLHQTNFTDESGMNTLFLINSTMNMPYFSLLRAGTMLYRTGIKFDIFDRIIESFHAQARWSH